MSATHVEYQDIYPPDDENCFLWPALDNKSFGEVLYDKIERLSHVMVRRYRQAISAVKREIKKISGDSAKVVLYDQRTGKLYYGLVSDDELVGFNYPEQYKSVLEQLILRANA